MFAGTIRFVLLAALLTSPCTGQELGRDGFGAVAISPRVELLSIVFRLAGSPEYRKAAVGSYAEAVDRHFAPFADHEAVAMARRLRRERGISFDAPMSLAVHLDPGFALRRDLEGGAAPTSLDARWTGESAREFAAALAKFARRADLDSFLAERKALFAATEERLADVLSREAGRRWFDGFFGRRPDARFILHPALLHGPANYGPRVLRSDGGEELYCILGVDRVDSEGLPDVPPEAVETIVHEFCHSYVNPLVDAHGKELEAAGRRLFESSRDEMLAQAYAGPRVVLYETVVRAVVVRWIASRRGEESARAAIADQERLGFHAVAAVADSLARYEIRRRAGGDSPEEDFADHFPSLVATLEAESERIASVDAARPRVAAIVPGNQGAEVDPGLEEIRVTFDRPMATGFSFVGGGPHFPETRGRARWSEDRRSVTLPVRLKPSWSYEFWLNRGRFDAFRSAEGVPLRPLRVAFSTRASEDEGAPRIVSMTPANGSRDVAPDLEEIRVTFDRPMEEGYSFVGGGPHFPATRGPATWSEDGRTVALPVRLKANWTYEFGLNQGRFKGFRSREGRPLAPVSVSFATGSGAGGG